MLYSSRMTLDSSLVIFYLVAAIAVGGVAVFLCWALYEVATFFHQTNTAVKEAREKIGRLERAILSIKDRLESSVSYLGMLAEGGKSLLSFLHTREQKKEKRRSKKGEAEEE